MSDLGQLEVVQKPLLISEAKIGGRRLTKSLWAQMPKYAEDNHYPVLEDGVQFRAWVNLHEKDCSVHYFQGDLGHEHRHVLVEHQGNVYRSTVWSSRRHDDPIGLWSTSSTNALVALMARNILAGHKVDPKRGWRINGQSVRALADYEIRDLPRYYMGSESQKADLARVAMLDQDNDGLIAMVQPEIDSEHTWRETVAEIWQLVTTETPQVYL